MASSGKKRTTFAKLNRENAVRERRLQKQAKKEARRQAQPEPPQLPDADAAPPADEADPPAATPATGA
jgi:hypothetical protein